MRAGLALALLAMTSAAGCSKPACTVPADIPGPMLEGRSVDEPRRVIPIAGYTLALSWSPERCADRMTSPMDRLRCSGAAGSFAFTLHGLWPDGADGQWPQYCTPARLVPDKVIREHLCMTPSPQLMQHEWEKHGTCMAKTPAEYFERSGRLFADLRYPDMDKLRGRPLTAASFKAAFADANAGMKSDQMRLKLDGQGWLEEVQICLDARFGRRSCPAGSRDVADGAPVRVR